MTEKAVSVGSVGSDGSDRSDRSAGKDGAVLHQRLRPSGGYRSLRSFQAATIIYDGTVSFCERFVPKHSRLIDQMVQAARSGRQNIAEGSRASAASSQTELRLVNVARASLDELLLDYEDYLRQHGLVQWDKDSPEARQVRSVAREREHSGNSGNFYAAWLNSPNPSMVANALICLIHQANFLLDKQIAGLEKQFIQDGGYTERLAAKRIAERQKQNRMRNRDCIAQSAQSDLSTQSDRSGKTDPTDQAHKPNRTIAAAGRVEDNRLAHGRGTGAPDCPRCSRPMTLRTARKGGNAGSQFWGCTAYPDCKGTRNLNGENA